MARIIAILILCAHLLMPIAVLAQEKAKSPLDYSLKHYGVMLGAAIVGGFVAWYNKVRRGELPAWSLNHLIGELATSAFAGLLTFWLCEWAGAPMLLTAAMTGVMGHMGTRGIALLEEVGAKRFGTTTIKPD
jgi:hypothetical protein